MVWFCYRTRIVNLVVIDRSATIPFGDTDDIREVVTSRLAVEVLNQKPTVLPLKMKVEKRTHLTTAPPQAINLFKVRLSLGAIFFY